MTYISDIDLGRRYLVTEAIWIDQDTYFAKAGDILIRTKNEKKFEYRRATFTDLLSDAAIAALLISTVFMGFSTIFNF